MRRGAVRCGAVRRHTVRKAPDHVTASLHFVAQENYVASAAETQE